MSRTAVSYWHDLQAQSLAREQSLPDADEDARWRALAATYDIGALHTHAPQIVRRLARLVRPGECVLEIGAGTGGFTLPLAQRAAHVTALDRSTAMLDILRVKLACARVENVDVRLGEWPLDPGGTYDVVLAVNSLYRIRAVDECIARMTTAARREVIVLWSVGHNPPVLPSLVDPAGPRGYRPGISYMHVLLTLHECGINARLALWRAPRRVLRTSYDEAANGLLSVSDPTPAERDAAARLARHWFHPVVGGVEHRYRGSVAVIRWPGTAQ